MTVLVQACHWWSQPSVTQCRVVLLLGHIYTAEEWSFLKEVGGSPILGRGFVFSCSRKIACIESATKLSVTCGLGCCLAGKVRDIFPAPIDEGEAILYFTLHNRPRA